MSVEAQKGYLNVKESSARARNRVSTVKEELKADQSLLGKAVANFHLIERLRNLPEVNSHLMLTDKDITLLELGYLRNKEGLYVTPEGYELRWRIQDMKWVESTILSEETIREMWSNKSDAHNNKFVKRLGKLKPPQIAQKFQDAVSLPFNW